MDKIRAAVVGYGNIGKYVIESLVDAPDFEITGIVRRDATNVPAELKGFEVVNSISQLENTEGGIVSLRHSLNEVAKQHNAVSIVSAGWDPGSDSVIRTLMEAMAPKGITYTNFGPGMSMGHTVAVKAVEGVKAALSMTIPAGTGIHRRMVYVELEEEYNFETVAQAIKTDDYFAHDETHVFQVQDVEALKDMGHGVLMERKGVSGNTQNQLFKFDMRINNPALTAQVMVGCARAALKQKPGAYTLIEIPVVDLLPGDREKWIKKLV